MPIPLPPMPFVPHYPAEYPGRFAAACYCLALAIQLGTICYLVVSELRDRWRKR